MRRSVSCCLSEQSLIHTERFHAACLANDYRTEMYDQEHGRIIENVIRPTRRHRVTVLLTLESLTGREKIPELIYRAF